MSVLRLIAKVRQTAAFVAPPSSAATTAAIFFGVDRDRASAPPAAAARRGEASANPLLDQRALELRQRAEDMEQEFALWGGGIHLFGQRAECDPALFQLVHRREQMGERSPETVEMGYSGIQRTVPGNQADR
jgi:hypothetical protein